MDREKVNALLGIFSIVVFFILASYFAHTNSEKINELIGGGSFGILFYIAATIIAEVIAPISATPLLPIAVSLWGWVFAAIYSIIGWTVGAVIAFWLARRYGAPLIKKFVPIKRLEQIEKRIPKENVFWGIVLLRMMIPVDLLSYALGLFSKIDAKRYTLATLIGVSPFAFIFSYVGALPFLFQINLFLFVLMIFLIVILIMLLIKARKKI